MVSTEYFVIGVMSGTSLDGVDLAYIKLYKNEEWSYDILKASTKAYSEKWACTLREAVNYSEEQLQELNSDYTAYLASIINNFISENSLITIDAICSHGHTILHQPEKGITLQIGNLPEIAKLIKQTVVCDFRIQDVELGGQGAPLVPIGDQLLFSDYDYCLNLGGFSNISIELNSKRIAYDISPVNIVMNRYVKPLGVDYDDRGRLAQKGKINDNLLNGLNSLSFYKQIAPKSLGLEWVKKEIFPMIDSYQLSVNDILRTFVEHIAIQISNQVVFGKKMLVTGGGAYNDFLISRIKELSNVEIIIPSNDLIEYKEALIFAFLGVLKLRGEVNVLASVTGAKKDHSSGSIFYYKNQD